MSWAAVRDAGGVGTDGRDLLSDVTPGVRRTRDRRTGGESGMTRAVRLRTRTANRFSALIEAHATTSRQSWRGRRGAEDDTGTGSSTHWCGLAHAPEPRRLAPGTNGGSGGWARFRTPVRSVRSLTDKVARRASKAFMEVFPVSLEGAAAFTETARAAIKAMEVP